MLQHLLAELLLIRMLRNCSQQLVASCSAGNPLPAVSCCHPPQVLASKLLLLNSTTWCMLPYIAFSKKLICTTLPPRSVLQPTSHQVSPLHSSLGSHGAALSFSCVLCRYKDGCQNQLFVLDSFHDGADKLHKYCESITDPELVRQHLLRTQQ